MHQTNEGGYIRVLVCAFAHMAGLNAHGRFRVHGGGQGGLLGCCSCCCSLGHTEDGCVGAVQHIRLVPASIDRYPGCTSPGMHLRERRRAAACKDGGKWHRMPPVLPLSLSYLRSKSYCARRRNRGCRRKTMCRMVSLRLSVALGGGPRFWRNVADMKRRLCGTTV